jgi:hypothetical protein
MMTPDSESGESLLHVTAYTTPPSVYGEVDRSVVMRSSCAGAALDPPLWIGPNKALSPYLSLALGPWGVPAAAGGLWTLERVYFTIA